MIEPKRKKVFYRYMIIYQATGLW